MSDFFSSRWPLLTRIVGEHRRVILALGIALGVNLLAYLLVVRPLSERVANVEQRNQDASQALAAAQMEHDRAAGTLTGKDLAVTELATFYTQVLPPDLAGARRLTHLRIARLARQSNLRYARSSSEPEREKESPLTRLKVEMELSGEWADLRAFIHRLETAPDFVIIDSVNLTESGDGAPLEVALSLSTYYRTQAP